MNMDIGVETRTKEMSAEKNDMSELLENLKKLDNLVREEVSGFLKR